ncbi:unnamed protein product, partial [Amoebophrya sp. A25]|eukprot:GSA25T00000059001.1
MPNVMPAFSTFVDRYCEKRVRRIAGGREIEEYTGVKRPQELHCLLTGSCMIRRRKDEVLKELPPKLRSKLSLDPTKALLIYKQMQQNNQQNKSSAFLEDVLGDAFADVAAAEAGGQKNNLKKKPGAASSSSSKNLNGLFLPNKKGGGNVEASEPAFETGENCTSQQSIMQIFQLTAECKTGPVCEYVEYLLTEQPHKFIVFAHHALMMNAVEELLKRHEETASYMRIDGGTKQLDRPEFVRRFQVMKITELYCSYFRFTCRVALLSITACGQGLTLTAASMVVFSELYWVPGQLQQAEDRAHRIGQTAEMVNVYYLTCPGTLDEHMYKKVEKKAGDCSSIM